MHELYSSFLEGRKVERWVRLGDLGLERAGRGEGHRKEDYIGCVGVAGISCDPMSGVKSGVLIFSITHYRLVQ